MATEMNFEWYAGNDFAFDVYYAIDGVAQDMTNYAVRMDIAALDSTGKAGRALISLNSEDIQSDLDTAGAGDNEITLDTNGKIHINVSREVTLSDLPLNDTKNVFGYDLFLRDKVTEKQQVLLYGQILVTRSVTQWR